MKVLMHLIFLTVATVIYASESTYIRDPDKPKGYFWETHKKIINICSTQQKPPVIKCYCDDAKLGAATRIYCWIFGEIPKESEFWQNFMSQPNLETVLITAFTQPGFTYFPTDLIRNATKLRNLEIEFGNIKKVPPFAFANSASLQQLSLADIQLVALEPYAFSHLTSLANLTISYNYIREIKRTVFYDLPNLERLKLSNNLIKTLHPGCFKDLTKLTHLNLHSNSLSVLLRESFMGLSNILRLNVKRNHLTYIQDLIFQDLWSLEELFLDDNQIRFISARGLSGLTRLKRLSLAGNQLTLLGGGTFVELKNINFMDLKNNRITELKEETFKPILENMLGTEFDIKLRDNNITCDCSLSWLKSLRNETRSLSVQTTLDTLLCSMETPIPVPLPTHFTPEEVTKSKVVVLDDYDYKELINEDPLPKNNLDSQQNFVEFFSIPEMYMPCKEKVQTSKSTMNLSALHSKAQINARLSGFSVALSIAKMLFKV